jgi:hypothetical protein
VVAPEHVVGERDGAFVLEGMTMSELGKSVTEAMAFLRGFYADVSKLVTVVDTAMTSDEARLASPWGAGSMWRSSAHFAYSSRWIPSYVGRQWVEAAPEGVQLKKDAGWYAFFVVHFAPQTVHEPAAIWGTARLNAVEYIWTSWGNLLLTDRGPKFLTQLPVEEWATLGEPGHNVRELRIRARAVVDLCDETTVQQVVVQPLLELVEQGRGDSGAG